jgi:hypothetical protein
MATKTKPAAPTEAPTPIKQEPNRAEVGEIVMFVMDDGRTIRPAIIVHQVTLEDALTTSNRRRYGSVDLQVFVDGSYDNDVRGAHANSTLTDFRFNIYIDEGEIDPETGAHILAPNTYFRKK